MMSFNLGLDWNAMDRLNGLGYREKFGFFCFSTCLEHRVFIPAFFFFVL
jgi:hypothetical protein